MATTHSHGTSRQGQVVGTGRLVRKDLTVFTPRDRWWVTGAFLMAALQTVRADELYFVVGLILAGALAVYVPALEWFHETDSLLHSLPVRRGTVVLARYVSALLAGGVALVVWVGAGWVLRPLLAPDRTGPAMWMTLEGLLTFASAFALLAALFFPLYFRLGVGRGALAFLGLLLVLVPAGYASAGLAWGPAAAGASLVLPSSLVGARVSALVGAVGPVLALGAVLAGIGVILTSSGLLSAHGLRRREF
ncbi:MAG: ABC-2 transporter permease [Gemmatimonadota bacterium]